MEVKEKSKKRELIKNVAIVFLAVLLLLTFFSNTIMNRSLPEVATQSISSGAISAKIRGSGTVAANESYEVIIDQTRQVRTVCVQVGMPVSQGDLLFVLEDVESEELKSAQEQLANLNLQYQQQLLTLSGEYATENRAIQVLREDLAKATAQRDANLVTAEEISYAKGDLETAKNELSQIERVLEELQALQEDNTELAAAQEYMDEQTAAVTQAESAVKAAQSAVETAQSTVEDYEEQLEELETTGGTDNSRAIEDARDALDKANYTWRSQWRAYSGELANLVEEVWNGANAPTINKPDTSNSTPQYITNEQQVYLSAYLTQNSGSQYEDAYEALIDAQEDVYAKERALERLLEDAEDLEGNAQQDRRALQRKLSEAEDDLEAAEDDLDTAEADLVTAQRGLRAAEYVLAQAESNNTLLKQEISGQEATQREKKAQVEDLTEALAALEDKKALHDQALEQIAAKEREIADALVGRDTGKQLDDLDLQATQMEIEKAQALVDKYTAQSVDTEITANVSGTITAINVTAGKETTAGAAMATIEIVDRGYTLKIPVTNEQSRQVKVGDTANVTNYYWGNDLEATLEAITSDPANPGTGKLLVFRVNGEVDAGTNLTLSIGQRSANYDAIIPKSALREDTNGYFVLVITVKSSPLSNRYIATRVDVQVLAEDDTSAAVSGLSAGDFVITTSSKPVEPGSQVRMVENP